MRCKVLAVATLAMACLGSPVYAQLSSNPYGASISDGGNNPHANPNASPGGVQFAYVADQTSYGGAAGSTVTVNLYLQETDPTGYHTLIGPGGYLGLETAALSVNYVSGAGATISQVNSSIPGATNGTATGSNAWKNAQWGANNSGSIGVVTFDATGNSSYGTYASGGNDPYNDQAKNSAYIQLTGAGVSSGSHTSPVYNAYGTQVTTGVYQLYLGSIQITVGSGLTTYTVTSPDAATVAGPATAVDSRTPKEAILSAEFIATTLVVSTEPPSLEATRDCAGYRKFYWL